jgi:glutathione S-transferase
MKREGLMITLYDLDFGNGARPSPFCWRAKFALAHKGLEWKEEPIGFVEKDRIAFSGQKLVPVIVDHAHDDKVVADSWEIATYLDQAYPGRSLFASEEARTFARFMHNWTDMALHAHLFRMIVGDMHAGVRPQDRDYFLQSRSRWLRTEDFAAFQAAARESRLVPFRQGLEPLRLQLKESPFLGGTAPGYPDYIVASALLWVRSVTSFMPLEEGDPLLAWQGRVTGLYGFDRHFKAAAA